MFHVLPDEGARIKVYFPNGVEKKTIAINSVRGGSEEMKSRAVFQKPTTKVFESPGAAKMLLGIGSEKSIIESGRLQTNADHFVLISDNRVSIQRVEYLIAMLLIQLRS